ncbi:hypothetical protein VYU27_006524 [Nannochloropsis oceanica]
MVATASTSTSMRQEPALVKDTLKRLQSLPNVQHVLILTKNGVALRSTLSPAATVEKAALITTLCEQATTVVQALGEGGREGGSEGGGLTFLRLCSKGYEVIITPDKDYSLVVVRTRTG